jgi:predicted enzyme related to lactoylglutathione lyase
MARLALLERLQTGQERHVEPDIPGRVGWHELLAADWKKALAFYCELFGWQNAEVTIGALGTYQRFSAGGQTIGGMATKPPKVPVPFWLYYFNIGDIDAAAKRVKVGGGQILNGPVEVPGGSWIVHCTDPQGAIFALVGKRRYKAMVFFEPWHDALPGESGPSSKKFHIKPRCASGFVPRPIAN